MVRTILIFIAGAVVGAGASAFAILVVLSRTPSRAESPTRTVTAIPQKAEAPASGVDTRAAAASAESSVEESVAAEPSGKTVPPLEATPLLADDTLIIPVAGVHRAELRDDFHDSRGGREHRALDIPAARGTPVLAAIDGSVGKLFLSKPGGMTIYEYDPAKQWIYYYAHLDGYAPGLVEGKPLRRGEVIGFVGTSGNAPPNAPHLHFSIEKLTTPGQWWRSEPVDPFPILTARGMTIERAK